MPILYVKTLILSNVFGIEKDKQLYDEAINNINEILQNNNIGYIDWSNNLINGDTTIEYRNYKNKFDFVVGNPPYVRVHHMDIATRNKLSSGHFNNGMKELYVYFYELGISMLNKTGKLCFITPNSFMKNSSQKDFRNMLIQKNLISSIYNFASERVFENAATYTCICVLDKNKHDDVSYTEATLNSVVFNKTVDTKYMKNNMLNKPWTFVKNMDLIYGNSENILSSICHIQYGVCTNADKVYLVNKKDADKFEKELLRPVVKASKQDASKMIIFPYASPGL